METADLFSSSHSLDNDTQDSFLLIALGGAGKESALKAQKQHEAAGRPFPMRTLVIDTDAQGFEKFDGAIDIAATHDSVAAMAADPPKHGPACQAVMKYHPDLLNPETIGHGARMTRILTQCAVELAERKLVEGLRKAIHALIRLGGANRIQPVVVASFGGGTGSAAIILLLDFLMGPIIRNQILLGLPHELLARPVLFAISGYSHALQQSNETAPEWILANGYATRVELAEYEKKGRGYQYVFHIGLGNSAGAIFATIDQVCEANGLLCWSWMAIYRLFKSHAVNNLDFFITRGRYCGDDIPELSHPSEEIPEYAECLDATASPLESPK